MVSPLKSGLRGNPNSTPEQVDEALVEWTKQNPDSPIKFEVDRKAVMDAWKREGLVPAGIVIRDVVFVR